MTLDYLWAADEILAALDGKLVAGKLQAANGVSIDSRDMQADDAFFAIKGDLFDGHDYAHVAAKNGASVVVISDVEFAAKISTAAVILVDDVLASLGRLAVAARLRTQAKIIAITGSVGKTSTKEFLRACLEKCGNTHASIKSFNNHWGVPISLARMPKNTEYGVFEIGMNHLHEITPLVKMVRPDLALITTIAPAHLGHFKDLEEIALAKSEIFDGMAKNGVAILNRDNEFFEFLSQKARDKNITDIESFGDNAHADMRLISANLLPAKSEVVATYKGIEFNYTISSAGSHQVKNSLGLLLAIACLGIDVNDVLPSLQSIELSDGRGAQSELKFRNGHIKFIDESYNANPASMVAAFGVLSAQQPTASGRKVAIVGDMLELGAESPQIHGQLAAELVNAKIDLVLACGSDMKNCYNLLPQDMRGGYAENSALLTKILNDKLLPNDVVMVKGSLGSRMSEIVNKINEISKASK